MANDVNTRTPLGLPPGSVRGILSLFIALEFWLLLLLPESSKVPIPINLYLLMTLVAVFFASHGKSIATASDPDPSPLYLPGGTLRFIILAGTVATIGYLYSNHPEWLNERLRPAHGQFANWPLIVGSYVGGLFVGYMLHIMPFRNHWFFQAFLAWISLIAMGLLFAEIIIQAFVKPTLDKDFDLPVWEAVVTAVTACYFGTRS
jgi:hypothetical protein